MPDVAADAQGRCCVGFPDAWQDEYAASATWPWCVALLIGTYTEADMIHAAIGDKATAAATPACWGIASVSDVNLLCDLDRVIDLNTKIANGTFNPMARWP